MTVRVSLEIAVASVAESHVADVVETSRSAASNLAQMAVDVSLVAAVTQCLATWMAFETARESNG